MRRLRLLLLCSATAALLGSLLLGCAYLAAGVRLAKSGTAGDARDLLRASVLYLPLLYLFLLVAKP